MIEKLNLLQQHALAALGDVDGLAALDEWRSQTLGRKGELSSLMRGMGKVPAEERPAVGQAANEVKATLEAAYETRRLSLAEAAQREALQRDAVDVTLPGRAAEVGRLHPETQTLREIYAAFADLGFQVYRSRDVELDEYNFQLLNFPLHHPARDMQDSFYVASPEGTEGDVLLRTHTSPGQVHAMREVVAQAKADGLGDNELPPVRIVLPGMCYRNEQITARSEIQFLQVEGLAVGKKITMADLKGTLHYFVRRLFGPQRKLRFRTSYFPFTEPSAEVDMDCILCEGSGCRLCKYTGWLEILGCGMVHPTVLRNGGYDPDIYSGFAFGMGPERITMLKYGIQDIRYFWSNDLRFLEQF
ncbi:MAG: phenylalanine--tRNA ligase subunit alpha [Ardenticatenales bacterium]|nr:phenylalanine--tRNA ligase subunit alpha [Ardenticatenales bacterium]MCB9172650.1 phenylalanine--tRNA ligase subunit alpha [Ardenticatenales bacterium]